MTEVQLINNIFSIKKKREIDWSQYLDFTRFIESGEIENDELDKYRRDFTL